MGQAVEVGLHPVGESDVEHVLGLGETGLDPA
ncbi:MAG: hypothetical protein RL689_1040, partial [Planctomycetota bacterium]